MVAIALKVAISNGGGQGKVGAGNWLAIKADKQLVYQPEEEELAQ